MLSPLWGFDTESSQRHSTKKPRIPRGCGASPVPLWRTCVTGSRHTGSRRRERGSI